MTMPSLQRPSSRRLLLVTLSYCVVPCVTEQHVYTDSFPANDEYDFTILDAYNIYGSPYGGFGRASRSRLAALPLHLPGAVGEFSETGEGPFMEVRDGDGRLFACHVYHEDELQPTSLSDSMFNTAKTKDPNEKPETPATTMEMQKTAEQKGETVVATKLVGATVGGSTVTAHADGTGTATITARATASVSVKSQAPLSGHSNMEKIISFDQLLSKLKGLCAQIHLGWWSYEWCHEDRVTQFHIHIYEQKNNDKDQELGVEDVTSLGTYRKNVSRKIQKHDKKVTAAGDTLKTLGEVIDSFENGDICPDTQKPRRATVKLTCCSLERTNKSRNSVLMNGRPIQSNIVAIQKVKETEVCNYHLEVCTPLLCEGMADAFQNTLFAEKQTKVKEQQEVPSLRKPRVRKENESIRDILEGTLQNTCLRFYDGGWWVYEICHERHVRQYHETDSFDAKTGVYSRVPESVHFLGYYFAEDLEEYPDKEEPLHVTVPNNDNDIGTSKKLTARNEGNGAYFEQEYTGGDVCDHSDVTDAAIKAGNVGEGGIERATTLRFFCGKELAVTKVNEDSTCHYVVDITLPDLCDHPLFKAPVVKKQVVKCLPVDESTDLDELNIT